MKRRKKNKPGREGERETSSMKFACREWEREGVRPCSNDLEVEGSTPHRLHNHNNH